MSFGLLKGGEKIMHNTRPHCHSHDCMALGLLLLSLSSPMRRGPLNGLKVFSQLLHTPLFGTGLFLGWMYSKCISPSGHFWAIWCELSEYSSPGCRSGERVDGADLSLVGNLGFEVISLSLSPPADKMSIGHWEGRCTLPCIITLLLLLLRDLPVPIAATSPYPIPHLRKGKDLQSLLWDRPSPCLRAEPLVVCSLLVWSL